MRVLIVDDDELALEMLRNALEVVARSIIIADSGTHFDPALVAAFLATEQQFLDVHNRYADEYAKAA